MADLLNVYTRQLYLKKLGFYKGKVDTIEGALTTAAYKELQKKYFVRPRDIDGKYGINTDTLLRNAYYVKVYAPNFKLEEFKCKCGGKYCTGYPKVLSINLLKAVQAIRAKYGVTTITSGMRCAKWNSKQRGSSANSYHLRGKAVDFKNSKTATLSGRREVMAYFKKQAGAGYTYCNENGSAPYMGTAIHIQVTK